MRLILRELSHSFGLGPALFAPLSLGIESGDIVALNGPSGSGKSTLLAIIAGAIRPSTGSIEWDGIRSHCWVLQNPHGAARRSAIDHVALPFLATGAKVTEARTRAASVMERFGLGGLEEHAFSELSGGQAQRLMLARAVSSNPSLLLIDEPTAQLDRTSAEQVIATIRQLTDRSRIVVIATHDVRVATIATRRIDLVP